MPFEGSGSNSWMANSFRYWDECVDDEDMEAMWAQHEVSTEWLDAGEAKGQRVHLSRDPDGQPYLTQTEMKAVVDIVVRRHFDCQIDVGMICALAELESDRQLLAMRYNKKTKETTAGILQIAPKTAEWLIKELDNGAYNVGDNPDLLHRPFINVYLGAAYIRWLSNFQENGSSEEFVVRAYKGGTKKATHKSTVPYWKRYLSVKESLPSRNHGDGGPSPRSNAASSSLTFQNTGSTGSDFTYWDSNTNPGDMEEMWRRTDVAKEWTKTGEKQGRVRFSQDSNKRLYLSRVELKAVADIILSKYFSSRAVRPSILCALAEIVSMRFVNGVGSRTGIMGIDYSTAFWLFMELGYRAYRVESDDDLKKPFVSMYFGAAYLAWLSEYEGRERTPQFVVQAYLAGPQKANQQETDPLWLNFVQNLSNYEDSKKDHGNCTIL